MRLRFGTACLLEDLWHLQPSRQSEEIGGDFREKTTPESPIDPVQRLSRPPGRCRGMDAGLLLVPHRPLLTTDRGDRGAEIDRRTALPVKEGSWAGIGRSEIHWLVRQQADGTLFLRGTSMGFAANPNVEYECMLSRESS